MNLLEISTLGGLSIKYDNISVTNLASRKAEALLVYLVCTRQAQSREVLADLLWDDRPQARAMANLRVLLTSLRKELGSYLTITRQTVAFNVDNLYWLDAAILERGLARVGEQQAGADSLSGEAVSQLAQILALYQGDFLHGFHLRHCQGFEEWQVLERERLRLRVIEALDELIAAHLTLGKYVAGIEQAGRLLQLDPLREHAHRQLMLLHAYNGQRSAALAQYDTCRQILANELGVEPTPETTDLYEQIRAGHFNPDQPIDSPNMPISESANLFSTPSTLPPTLPAQQKTGLPQWMKGEAGKDNLIPFMVETLPVDFIPRPAELEPLLKCLLAPQHSEAVALTTALRGAGGYGKTTLAQAICHDKRVQEAFPSGVLWVTLGERPRNLEGMVEDFVYKLSGERPGFASLGAARDHLAGLLDERALLLVIDDVWNGAHLKPFLHGGPQCARLITTRDRTTLPPNTAQIDVDAMRQVEAVALLKAGLPVETLPAADKTGPATSAWNALAGRLGHWPLLLKLVNAVLLDRVGRRGQAITEALQYVERALDKKGLTAFDARNPLDREQAVSQTLGVSLELLDSAEYKRYVELAIFPEDIEIPLTTLERLWAATAGLDTLDTEALCDRLYQLSLLLHFDLQARTIRLHDVIRAYLINQTADDLRQVHAHLLEAHRPTSPPSLLAQPNPISDDTTAAELQNPAPLPWADLPLYEPYLWTHLAYHLIEAERRAELVNTVKDLRYLAIKTHLANSYAAETDLLAAETQAPDDTILPILRRYFILAGHLLNRCEALNELAATLYSRLQHLETLKPLTERFLPHLTAPYLIPWRPLPDLPLSSALQRSLGHPQAIYCCVFSPDGRRIISASADKTLKIWDVETGLEMLVLNGHTDTVHGCAISPNGDFIVSASYDKTLKVWDAQTGIERFTLEGHKDIVWRCAVSPNGDFIVSSSVDKTLKVWDAQTGAERFTLEGHTSPVLGCAISPDANFIVSSSGDKTLKVWDAQIGAERLTLEGHTGPVWGCATSSDGTFIVSSSYDKTLKVWDTQTGAERRTITGHTAAVSHCAISPDGQLIASSSFDRTVRVWWVETGAEYLTLPGHTTTLTHCVFNENGRLVASTSEDNSLKIWDIHAKDEHQAIQSDRATIWGGVISPDGSYIASGSITNHNDTKVWDVQAGRNRFTLTGHNDKVFDAAFSPDGSFIVSASKDKTLKVWDMETGNERLTLSGHAAGVWGCTISPNSHDIVSASEDKTLKVWDAQTGAERLTLHGHTAGVNDCTISPDSSFIVSASDDKTLRVWNRQTGANFLTLIGHTEWVMECTVSPDSSFIVSASKDKTLKVWDMETGNERLTLSGHAAGVWGCTISPNSRYLASASVDGMLKIWDLQDAACLAGIMVDGRIFDVIWFLDDQYIIAVGGTGGYFLRLVW